MRERRKKPVILLRVAGILLILVILTTSIVSGRYARYVTMVSDGASARVARFRVEESGELLSTLSVSLSPTDTIQKTITVENASEVTIEYTVTVENLYENLPLEYRLLSGDKETTKAVLLPGQSGKLCLEIHWQDDKWQDDYINMVDLLVVKLIATQVD